jgi:FKBP-type peptidyl-prolyl cis-trans isomerase SlyD
MRITSGSLVTLVYRTTDAHGVAPGGWRRLSYRQGTGELAPELQVALEGKAPGDRVRAELPPAFHGERDPGLVQEVSRDRLPPGTLEPGMRFHLHDDEAVLVLTVVAVQGDRITIDANHPLAGAAACFEAVVRAVQAPPSDR